MKVTRVDGSDPGRARGLGGSRRLDSPHPRKSVRAGAAGGTGPRPMSPRCVPPGHARAKSPPRTGPRTRTEIASGDGCRRLDRTPISGSDTSLRAAIDGHESIRRRARRGRNGAVPVPASRRYRLLATASTSDIRCRAALLARGAGRSTSATTRGLSANRSQSRRPHALSPRSWPAPRDAPVRPQTPGRRAGTVVQPLGGGS